MKTWALLVSLFFLSLSFAQEDSCIVYLPNTITPDCETAGCECFGIVSNCEYEGFEFRIYNRWGEILFETTDQKEEWCPDASETPDGVYVWQIKYLEKADLDGDAIYESEEVKTMNGHVTYLK